MRRLLCLLLLLMFSVPAFAHPGRTDSSGGHYNRSTGEYHFHHGEPAHQHPGGVCPYAASAKATAKPSTGSSRSSTVKTSSSVAAAVQSIKKEMNPSMIDAFIVSTFLVIIAVLACVAFCLLIKLRQVKKDFETASSNCASARLECNRLKSELVEKKDEVRRLTESCTNASNSYVSAIKELQTSDNTIRGLRDLVIASSDQCSALRHQLDELGQQYNDLYSVWSDSQLVCYENPAVISEAMVYVNDSGIYHTRVHGNWREYKLIPLREALALRYRPCSICVPYDRPKF